MPNISSLTSNKNGNPYNASFDHSIDGQPKLEYSFEPISGLDKFALHSHYHKKTTHLR